MKKINRYNILVAILVCATWCDAGSLELGKTGDPSDRPILLAGMTESQNAVTYGAGTAQSTCGESGSEAQGEQLGAQNKRGYLQYQAGPTQAQVAARQQEESAKEAASMNMLPYLFIDLGPGSRVGPVNPGR